jgi:hypothetical protein
MPEKDKGFSFKQLFFRDTTPVSQDQPIQKSTPAANNTQDDFLMDRAPQATSGGADQALVDDFVKRLQNLINQNNQPGFDFLEFTESLFEERQNPGPEVYKTVFRIAQKIDKSLTPSKLLDSSMFYKDLVQRTAESEISKGTAKKQGLQGEKDNEKNSLDSGLRDTRAKIQQLTKQIQDLQNQEISLNNQLLAIDQKYESKFIDIDRKVNAIRSAKEQVLVSIVDIESGIKSNLS